MTIEKGKVTYEKLDELGRGGFGVVYRGNRLVNGQFDRAVAIKTYYHGFDDNEFKILSMLEHPNIINLLDRFEDIDQRGISFTSLVLEYANGGTLLEKMGDYPNGMMEQMALQIILRVAEALNYLHTNTNRIVHRDVKLENILFHNEEVKLADVGIAKQIYTTTERHTGVQTFEYAAPEMLPGKLYDEIVVSPKADIYSLGITAYVLRTGKISMAGQRNAGCIASSQHTISKNVRLFGIL